MFAFAGGGDGGVTLGVVDPGVSGGDPTTTDPAYRPVHVQYLEHLLQTVAPQVHTGFQASHRHRFLRCGQHLQCLTHGLFRGEGKTGEVFPDLYVLPAGQQDHLGTVHASTGSTDLLVVGDRGLWCAQVDHETEVGFVEPHAQGAGCHQGLDPVGQQVVLGLAALLGFGLSGVGTHLHTLLGQEAGRFHGCPDGEGVDDARSGDRGQVLGQPAETGRGVGKLDHGQPQTFPFQGAAQYEGVLTLRTGTKLFGHVASDSFVRGGGGGQYRHTLGQIVQQGTDTSVVGAEVMPPVGDAVSFVDDDQPRPCGKFWQDPVAKLRVVEAFGADQQHVHPSCGDVGVDLLPGGGVGTVDGACPDPGAFGGGDLVAHQCQQGGDDHGGSGSLGAAQCRGHEIHGRLAPAGALDDQGAPVLEDQCSDGPPLVVVQLRVLSGKGT